jgi:fumarate reductase (CoM/CoB) subunit A
MNLYECDVLVIGAGAAGCRAAYEAKKSRPELEVILTCSGKQKASGSTNLDASEALGINAPLNSMEDGDNPSTYYSDIISTGDKLCDPKLCRIISNESFGRINELIDMGVPFDKKDGKIWQQKLSGCTKARSLTCGGGTGRAICEALMKENLRLGVRLIENTRVLALCRDEYGAVCGAWGMEREEKVIFSAKSVILATGGAGGIFSQNVNTLDILGDGWAMAYDVGARFVNMEFFQVGPAAVRPAIKFIIHSHMWRLNPKLTNSQGDEFLPLYCPEDVSADDALYLKAMSYPFSVRTNAMYVDIAIFKEIMSGRGTKAGGVYFDLTHVSRDEFLEKAPITYRRLLNAGLDLTKEKLELGLAVQNFNGGILIDENGFTGVNGLYAAGEVTGGVHGSDRPGGNNLTDTQVFGYRAGRAAAEAATTRKKILFNMSSFSIGPIIKDYDAELLRTAAKLFYQEMTIVRNGSGLEKVLSFISEAESHDIGQALKNRLIIGKMLATAMLERPESRGTHYREDFPLRQDKLNKRIVISKGEDTDLKLETIHSEIT